MSPAKLRDKVLGDVLAIAELARVHMSFARQSGVTTGGAELVGFINECDLIIGFYLTDNPSYVPISSTARADSGYYSKNQTHDVSLIYQSYGTIRKIIPIEVKKRPESSNARRYDALLLHAADMARTGDNPVDVERTLELFSAIFNGVADASERYDFATICSNLRKRVTKYQNLHPSPRSHAPSKTVFLGGLDDHLLSYHNRRKVC